VEGGAVDAMAADADGAQASDAPTSAASTAARTPRGRSPTTARLGRANNECVRIAVPPVTVSRFVSSRSPVTGRAPEPAIP